MFKDGDNLELLISSVSDQIQVVILPVQMPVLPGARSKRAQIPYSNLMCLILIMVPCLGPVSSIGVFQPLRGVSAKPAVTDET